MNKIILITGGQRSGKSRFAEQMALSLDSNPVYLATSRVWDEEHRKRIEKHKVNRGSEWINIEEDQHISKYNLEEKILLIDCITLWATNFFFDLNSNVEEALSELKKEFDAFTSQNSHFIFVTNEIGMGEMSQNELQRKFADLQGWFNQYVASRADEVYLMVSGIAMKIK